VELVESIYRVTAAFPREEVYALTSQMRRAALSVPANIAEGAARRTTAELVHFLGIASGSLSELDTHVEVAKRLGYIVDAARLEKEMDDVFALLSALASSLRRKQSSEGVKE
jgi:four helix bundle protein